jgi:sulfopyruvate decarboxylase subunit beta
MIHPSDVCRLLAGLRGEAIVVACQTVRGPWHAASKRPELDVLFKGVMGKGSSLGLGLALARPERPVLVLDGDGSLLMNLGSLATIIDSWPRNLFLFVFDNGVYAGTGGQRVPGAGRVSFEGFGRAAGFPLVEFFDEFSVLASAASGLLARTGPALIHLKTHPIAETPTASARLPRMISCLIRLEATLRGINP